MPLTVILFLIGYPLFNLFIFIRFWKVMGRGWKKKAFFTLAFWTVAGGYIFSHLLDPFLPGKLVYLLNWIGSWWIGFAFYFFIYLILAGLALRILRMVGFLPRDFDPRRPLFRRWLVLGGAGLVIIILIIGYANALLVRTRTVEITIEKKCGQRKELNLVFLSDIHLGHMVGKDRLKRIVGKVNVLKPELILLGGDIVDADIEQSEMKEFVRILWGLDAPLGVFAVTGNHEYIAGVKNSVSNLSRAGIIFLRDEWTKIDGCLYLVGREDSSRRWRGGDRKTVGELMEGVNLNLPVILMDHRPARLEEEISSGADLILCGHTHHGQLFPINLVTGLMYGVSWGHTEEGETDIYVTSGAGTWGPPVRIGNRPEIVEMRLVFRGKERSGD